MKRWRLCLHPTDRLGRPPYRRSRSQTLSVSEDIASTVKPLRSVNIVRNAVVRSLTSTVPGIEQRCGIQRRCNMGQCLSLSLRIALSSVPHRSLSAVDESYLYDRPATQVLIIWMSSFDQVNDNKHRFFLWLLDDFICFLRRFTLSSSSSSTSSDKAS